MIEGTFKADQDWDNFEPAWRTFHQPIGAQLIS